MTEDAIILRHLQSGATITPAQAYESAGCLALHSAIARLRKAGHNITCTIRSGNGKRWGEYALVGQLQLIERAA